MKRLWIVLAVAIGAVTPAVAVTKTFSWTWPTLRTDSSALPLSQIGAFTLYDTSVPVPGQPGTVVACPTTIPPTTATGTCSANVTAGHSFAATVSDTASPPDVGPISNSVTIPLSAPAAITDLRVN